LFGSHFLAGVRVNLDVWWLENLEERQIFLVLKRLANLPQVGLGGFLRHRFYHVLGLAIKDIGFKVAFSYFFDALEQKMIKVVSLIEGFGRI